MYKLDNTAALKREVADAKILVDFTNFFIMKLVYAKAPTPIQNPTLSSSTNEM